MTPTNEDYVKVRNLLAKRFGEDIAQEVVMKLLERFNPPNKGKELQSFGHLKNYAIRSAYNLRIVQAKGKVLSDPRLFFGLDTTYLLLPNDLEHHKEGGGVKYFYRIQDGIEELPIKLLSTVEGQMKLAKVKKLYSEKYKKFKQLSNYLNGSREVSRQRIMQIRKELKELI